jgi:hypothetical protein
VLSSMLMMMPNASSASGRECGGVGHKQSSGAAGVASEQNWRCGGQLGVGKCRMVSLVMEGENDGHWRDPGGASKYLQARS